jgi:iron complex outermembrane recepter protein
MRLTKINAIISFFFIVVWTLCVLEVHGQQLTGTVRDQQGNPVVNASVYLTDPFDEQPQVLTTTSKQGNFLIAVNKVGRYRFRISHVGYRTFDGTVSIQRDSTIHTILYEDILGLDEVVVTGTFIPSINIGSSVSLSLINKKAIDRNSLTGVAGLLQAEPGIYSDPSAGEIFTRVYMRGVSVSAEDDLGWYYISLQEDGLPITAVQFASFAPDFFQRVDNSIERVEVLRGGSSSITSANAPGGALNFVSHEIKDAFHGMVDQTIGFHANGETFLKSDLIFGSTLGNNWNYTLGGYFREDDGARNVDYDYFSRGGQIKLAIQKKIKNSRFTLRSKYLNDRVNRWTGVTAQNWESPKPAYDQDFNYTAQLIPGMNAKIPDGQGNYYDFDPSKGIHLKEYSTSLQAEIGTGNWLIKNNLKFSYKTAGWQTSLSTAKLDLNNPLPYFISGASFPIGEIVFTRAETNQEIARLDNSGILDGNNPSFTYLTEGRLPFDALLGVAAWYKDDRNVELMNQFSVSRELNKHHLEMGFFASYSDVQTTTRASFAYATYEAQPIALKVTLENPGQDVIHLSDKYGLSNYGGLFFEQSDAAVTQVHLFAQDKFDLSDQFQLDLGLRLDMRNYAGYKSRIGQVAQDGGRDQDPLTEYDNSILIPSGIRDHFDHNYSNYSYSVGLNYEPQTDINFFGRFTRGTKSPELNYYFDNFSNQEIPGKGPVEKVYQAEIGLKFVAKKFSMIPVFFWSSLADVGSTNFVFDSGTNELFYTPMQFNSTRTIGLEMQAKYFIKRNFSVLLNGTFQTHEATDYTVYDAKGTIIPDDDQLIDFSGNQVPFLPRIMFHVTPEYSTERFSGFITWTYMGERQGNIANAFSLPSFSMFGGGISYLFKSNFVVSLESRNLFNSTGLMNFYGPNFFGASKDDATQEFVDQNPNAGFVVVPTLARMLSLKIRYSF